MPPRSAPAIGRGAIASIAVVATPRDASKQGGQDPVRTLSAAAIVIAAALRILLAQSPFPLVARRKLLARVRPPLWQREAVGRNQKGPLGKAIEPMART